MPTASKLIGAALFFGVGWLAAVFVLDTFEDEIAATYFPLAVALIGATQGWFVSGGNTGGGIRAGIGFGMRTSVQTAAIGLFIFALREMFDRAADLRYDGAGEAVIASIELAVEYFIQMATVPVWGTLLIGGAVAGLLVELSSKMWR